MTKWTGRYLLVLFASMTFVLTSSCTPPAASGGGGGQAGEGDGANNDADNGAADEPVEFTMPLPATLGSFELQENEPAENNMAFDMPIDLGPYRAITIDVGATLAAATVTLPEGTTEKQAIAMQTSMAGQTTWCVGAMDSAETSCETGDMYGPFDVSLDENMQPVMEEEVSVSLTQSSLDLINSGQFSLSIQLLSSIPAFVSIDQLFVLLSRPTFESPTGDDCAAPADIAGTWVGTWTCENSCGDPIEGGDITLTITQNGSSASYTDDGGAMYQGTVCGNVFTFDGGGDGYTESGQFTLAADGSAKKESTWVDDFEPLCGGNCMDQLMRAE